MSRFETDFVVNPVRVSQSKESSFPTSGVVRDVKVLPADYTFPIAGSRLADSGLHRYKTSFLEKSESGGSEYLVWAANNSNIALVDDDAWYKIDAESSIPPGSRIVIDTASSDGFRYDGTTRITVSDSSGRTIGRVLWIKAHKGDTPSVEFTLNNTVDYTMVDPSSGVVQVNDTVQTRTYLSPKAGEPASFSKLRGDEITEVAYVLEPLKFWWTRNDESKTRFNWGGKRWEPIKGSSPIPLGVLTTGGSYELNPKVKGLTSGDYLPGLVSVPDSYCMIRVGTVPDSTSLPVGRDTGGFDGILVVDDQELSSYDFSVLDPAAIVGKDSQVLIWNPAYLSINAGYTVWYIYDDFSVDANGDIGLLLDSSSSNLFIAPIPNIGERPFIRLGSRRYLTPTIVDNDLELSTTPVLSGYIGVSRSTGKLKFATEDVNKSDPSDTTFDPNWLDTRVFYDGIALNAVPQPLKSPVALVGAGGNDEAIGPSNPLYIPDAVPLPGLGISGIIHTPDGTGTLPSIGTPSVRPGGDETSDTTTGLIRKVEGVGDVVLFNKNGSITDVVIVGHESEIPTSRRKIPSYKAYVSREKSTGSRVEIGKTYRSENSGEFLYFLQADFLPARYVELVRLISNKKGPFTFDGTERLNVAIDGVPYEWKATAGTFTSDQVAQSIELDITPAGICYSSRGYVVIESSTKTSGSIEIGASGLGTIDLSAASILGFSPYSLVDTAKPWTFWVQDSGGLGIGVFRSSLNKDSKQPVPDYSLFSRISDEVVSNSVQPTPFSFIGNKPLMDVGGYDDAVFFKTVDEGKEVYLKNYQDVLYQFDGLRSQFSWLSPKEDYLFVDRKVSTINTTRTNLVPGSLYPSVWGGLYVSDGGVPVQYNYGDDYYAVSGGAPGSLILVEKLGEKILTGFAGKRTTLTRLYDASVDFVDEGVQPGYLLKIGDGTVYKIVTVAAGYVVIEYEFESTSSIPETYSIYEYGEDDENDEALLADILYEEFDHLGGEYIGVYTLKLGGTVPEDQADQLANRRQVDDLLESYEKDREVTVRVGLDGADYNAYFLETEVLGTVSNGILFVDTTDVRVSSGNFNIRVGNTVYMNGADLNEVVAFSSPIPAGNVEYLGSTGELGFASDILSDYLGGQVQYEEDFFDTSLMPPLVVEIDPFTGYLNFSDWIMSISNEGDFYVVEKMIVRGREDVSSNPLTGSFSFIKPITSGKIVEVSYIVADSSGEMLTSNGAPVIVTEKLPVYVSREAAVRINSRTYSFNPTSRTISSSGSIDLYVGIEKQNYRTRNQASFDLVNNQILFSYDVDSASNVWISYQVYESFGGEVSYNASRSPMYRAPFWIDANSPTFEIPGSVSAPASGSIMRVGDTTFYIKSVSYDPITDTRTVTIYPTFDKEVGSRSPANDLINVITYFPVTDTVDGGPAGDDIGFFKSILSGYETVNKNHRVIRFTSNVYDDMVPGKILEVGGVPYTIATRELSEDGGSTEINITSTFVRQHTYGVDSVKLSMRPIYPVGAQNIVGVGEIYPNDDFEVFLLGDEIDTMTGPKPVPGRSLTYKKDYDIDLTTGNITLLGDNKLSGGKIRCQLLFSGTRVRSLSPKKEGKYTKYPRIKAKYLNVQTPSSGDGRLGKKLYGTYSYLNPDSFYFNVEKLSSVSSDVFEDVESDSVSSNQQKPVFLTSSSTENDRAGSTGPLYSLCKEKIKDRVGRAYIDLFNSFISGLEQTLESIDGMSIGDRDGRFKLFVGYDSDYPGPGFEDFITGEIVRRVVWSDVFSSLLPVGSDEFFVLEGDPIVDPSSATMIGGLVSGYYVKTDKFKKITEKQKELIVNDIDDVLLVSRERARKVFVSTSFPPRRKKISYGKFAYAFEPSRFSRLYPESVSGFTTTLPGIEADEENEDPGFYSFGRMILNDEGEPEKASSYGQPIATISNPVMGVIQNVTDVEVSKRLPRARVVLYLPSGYPGAVPPSPALILSMVPVNQFPVDPVTGEPDTTKLRSMSASDDALADIETGDPELNIPGFVEDTVFGTEDDFIDRNPQQLLLGKPDGRILDLRASDGTGIYTHEVVDGCYLTFRSSTAAITSPNDVYTAGSSGALVVATFETGDTIMITFPGATSSALSNPPTTEELDRLRRNQNSYRIGFDVGLDKKNGELIDITKPSIEDPTFFAMKEFLGQNPPDPEIDIQLSVKLINSRTEPLEIPALNGEYRNDSGDESVPYLYKSESEKEALYRASTEINNLKVDSTVPNSVYPDEFYTTDVEVFDAYTGTVPPAAFITSTNVIPAQVNNSGIGQLRQYDIAFAQLTGDIAGGCQGIVNVGDVTYDAGLGVSIIEPPRFLSKTRKGDRIRYSAQNAMVYYDVNPLNGITIQEAGGSTILTSNAPFVFNDGGVPTVGGLNRIISNSIGSPNENRISLDFFSKAGVLAGYIMISGDPTNSLGFGGTPYVYNGNWITGTWNGFSAAAPTFGSNVVTIPTTGFFNFVAAGGAAPGPVGPFNFKVSVYAMSGITGDVYTGSDTGWIDEDRLTFHECFDLSRSYARTKTNKCYLNVYTVTGPESEDLLINASSALNDEELTFLDRGYGLSGEVGLFTPASVSGAGDEDGTLKAMAVEGRNNTSITTSAPVTISLAPSSNYDEVGIICEGWGYCDGDDNNYEDRIYAPTVTDGELSRIVKGDLLVVKEAYPAGASYPNALATTKAGTYIVRDIVEGDGVTADDPRKLVLDSVAGSNSGWIPFVFPTIVDWDDGVSPSITVDSLLPFPYPSAISSPTGHAFKASGTIYAIVDISRINDTGLGGTYDTSIISASYTSVDSGTKTFELTGGANFYGASGGAISQADFFSLLRKGQRLSGMMYFMVDITGMSGLTDHNPVGVTTPVPNPVYYGLPYFALSSDIITPATLQFSYLAGNISDVSAPDVVVVTPKTKGTMNQYPVDDGKPAYENILGMVDLGSLTNGLSWSVIHVGGAPYGLDCILPGEHLIAADISVSPYDPGFYAQPGIFLEPSTPRVKCPSAAGGVWDYSAAVERVVDNSRSLDASEIGMEKYSDWDAVGSFAIAEPVKFEIRRIRRFHGEPINEPIRKMLSLYEIRDSIVVSYSPNNNGSCSIVILDTQFGDLYEDLNNINPGDVFRILDSTGLIFDSPILSISGSNTIVIRNTPSFDPAGYDCQIYLKTTPIPHEQSYDEITENTFTEVFRSTANYTTNEGGWVEFDSTYGDSINRLQDTEVITFSGVGVEEGDYLVVDPAGSLIVPGGPAVVEVGTRPIGDYSVNTRIDGSHVVGYPSELDDNRGVYKVLDASGQFLVVDGNLPLSGDLNGSDVILGDDTSNNFVVYPTVNDSQLTGGKEGQNDLRPTSYAVGGTFTTDYYSIAPFSYKILRSSPYIPEKASQFVLQMRERIKSWIDNLRNIPSIYDSYDDFQNYEYIENVDLGIVSNAVISDISGYTEIAPFANDNDCLSILDRRYWIMDMKLDYTMPPFTGVDYYSDFVSESGLPVYQDFVDDILSNEDDLRGLRMFWIDYRTNLLDGTLAKIKNAEQRIGNDTKKSNKINKVNRLVRG